MRSRSARRQNAADRVTIGGRGSCVPRAKDQAQRIAGPGRSRECAGNWRRVNVDVRVRVSVGNLNGGACPERAFRFIRPSYPAPPRYPAAPRSLSKSRSQFTAVWQCKLVMPHDRAVGEIGRSAWALLIMPAFFARPEAQFGIAGGATAWRSSRVPSAMTSAQSW